MKTVRNENIVASVVIAFISIITSQVIATKFIIPKFQDLLERVDYLKGNKKIGAMLVVLLSGLFAGAFVHILSLIFNVKTPEPYILTKISTKILKFLKIEA